jgi:CubicO group peptidase (beta-lactamase class C family)
MKKTPAVILLMLILIQWTPATGGLPAAGGQVPPQPLVTKDLEAVVSDLEAGIPALMKKGRVPGLQIALVRDGRVVWQRSFGVANASTGAAVTEETLFEAASLTKPFFAYAVMKMVDEGLIDLDKPIHAYFSRDEVEKWLGHSLEAKDFRRDWFEKVTGRHVLSHSGGLPHGERGEVLPIFFEPGTKWKYSADGYQALQAAVEKLKGEKLDTIMQKYVLDPLGMKRSGMVWRPASTRRPANTPASSARSSRERGSSPRPPRRCSRRSSI